MWLKRMPGKSDNPGMRPLRAVLVLMLAAGCSGGTDAALTAQDATSALTVKNGALSQLAESRLTLIRQAAQSWAAAHAGDMTGFAEDFRTEQPSVASTAATLTDTSVTVTVSQGQCLLTQLPAGSPVPIAC